MTTIEPELKRADIGLETAHHEAFLQGWRAPAKTLLPPPFELAGRTKVAERTLGPENTANVAIGNPVVLPDLIEREMRILHGTNPRVDNGPTVDLAHFVTNWTQDHLLPHLTQYSPVGGFQDVQAALQERLALVPNGADRKFTTISGGAPKAIEHIDAVLREAQGPNARIETIDISDSGLDEGVRNRAEAVLQAGGHVVFITENSSKQSITDRDALVEILQRDRTFVIDKLSEAIEDNITLSTIPEINNRVISISNTPTDQITGVVGIFGNEVWVEPVENRHTALSGATSTAQQDLAMLAMEVLVNAQLAQSVRNVDLDQLRVYNSPFLTNMVTTLQRIIRYNDGDAEALEEHRAFNKTLVEKFEKANGRFHE